jgi:hypothetical protein
MVNYACRLPKDIGVITVNQIIKKSTIMYSKVLNW